MNDKNERYILGFPEMDVQHEYCYSLFDAIETTAASGDKDRITKLLHEIEIYLMFHFECEEHLMRMYGAPGFAVHQSDHERVGHKLVEFLDDFEAGRLNSAAMRIFFTGWLMEHSLLSDSEYVAWIKQRRTMNVGEGSQR